MCTHKYVHIFTIINENKSKKWEKRKEKTRQRNSLAAQMGGLFLTKISSKQRNGDFAKER